MGFRLGLCVSIGVSVVSNEFVGVKLGISECIFDGISDGISEGMALGEEIIISYRLSS